MLTRGRLRGGNDGAMATAWCVRRAVAIAIAVAAAVAGIAGARDVRAGYLDPAAFASLGAAPDGGYGWINQANRTFTGVSSGREVRGVMSGNVLVFTFDSVPNLGFSIAYDPGANYAIAILSKGDLTLSSGLFLGGRGGQSTSDPVNGPGGGGYGGGAYPGSGGSGTPGRGGGGAGASGSGGALGGGGSHWSNGMGGGGGALELGAMGVLRVNGEIDVKGGGGCGAYGHYYGAGGGGGGGSVTLVGDTVIVNGPVTAYGGGGGGGVGWGGPGGAGGGGFVTIVAGAGGVTLGGTIDVSGGDAQRPGTLDWTTYDGAGGGGGGTIAITSTGAVNLLGTIDVAGGNGKTVGANGTFLIPEPSAGVLLALGAVGLLGAARGRRR